MATKKTIRIDREKCVGCGQCVNHCPGGALQMVDGKAKLVREDFCDGLGVCIGECPVDAITFEDVEVETPAVATKPAAPASAHHAGCPGHANQVFKRNASPCAGGIGEGAVEDEDTFGGSTPSELTAWPIQLHLIRPEAEQFVGTDVVIAASCSAFACGSFHKDFLRGKGLIIACPKLDKQEGYLEKLTQLFASSAPKSVTVVRMVVPCCSGLTRTVLHAREAAGSELKVTEATVALDGSAIEEKVL